MPPAEPVGSGRRAEVEQIDPAPEAARRRLRFLDCASQVVSQRPQPSSFGWSGAYGTHFWVDQKEDLIAVLMIQTPVRDLRPEFENAVMQSIIK